MINYKMPFFSAPEHLKAKRTLFFSLLKVFNFLRKSLHRLREFVLKETYVDKERSEKVQETLRGLKIKDDFLIN